MKGITIIYWITTALLSLLMMFSAYAYLTFPVMQQSFQHLGFPNYFRIELAAAKLIGAFVLLLPVQMRWKEWAYAGFGITFISAFIAHTSSGDPVSVRVMPLIALGLLIISYRTFGKKSKTVAQSFPLQKVVFK